jgi:hypothetical protein
MSLLAKEIGLIGQKSRPMHHKHKSCEQDNLLGAVGRWPSYGRQHQQLRLLPDRDPESNFVYWYRYVFCDGGGVCGVSVEHWRSQ